MDLFEKMRYRFGYETFKASPISVKSIRRISIDKRLVKCNVFASQNMENVIVSLDIMHMHTFAVIRQGAE